jgi:RNA polymerase sigma-70 factor (ECF subfamily)
MQATAALTVEAFALPGAVRCADDDHDDGLDALFNADGTWREPPVPLPLPVLSEDVMHTLIDRCLTRLPAAAARAWAMREFEGLDVDEICAELCISRERCSALLQRARLELLAALRRQ